MLQITALSHHRFNDLWQRHQIEELKKNLQGLGTLSVSLVIAAMWSTFMVGIVISLAIGTEARGEYRLIYMLEYCFNPLRVVLNGTAP